MQISSPTVAIIGPEECGKSTLIGYFMYTLARRRYYAEDSKIPISYNVEFYEWWENAIKTIDYGPWRQSEARFAYLVDTFEHERNDKNINKTMTKDLNFIQFRLREDFPPITLVNVPGHFRFWTKIVSASSISDFIILMVDATSYKDDYSIPSSDQRKEMKGAGGRKFPRGIMYSTLASFISTTKMYVVVSKMDLVEYSEDVFHDICAHVSNELEAIGFKKDMLNFIPISIDRDKGTGHNVFEHHRGKINFNHPEALSFQECLEDILDTTPLFTNEDALILDIIPKTRHHSQITTRLRSGTLSKNQKVTCIPISKKIASLGATIRETWMPYRSGKRLGNAERIPNPERYPPGSIFSVKIDLSHGDHIGELQALIDSQLKYGIHYHLANRVKCLVMTSMLCDEIRINVPIQVTSRGFVGRALARNIWKLGPVYDFKKILHDSAFDLNRFSDNNPSADTLTYYDIGVMDIELLDGPLFLFIDGGKKTMKSFSRYRDTTRTMFVHVVDRYGLVPFSIISLDQYSIGAVGRLIDMG